MNEYPDTHLSDSERLLAHMLALLSLPRMGPVRLTKLLEQAPAEEVWAALLAGESGAGKQPGTPPLAKSLSQPLAKSLTQRCLSLAEQAEVPPSQMLKWCQGAQQIQPHDTLAAYQDHAVSVAMLSSEGEDYPRRLSQDIEPPAVLFWQGDISILDSYPTAAIVGTRSCSNYGREIAFELGHALSSAGVCVVSGLALGIDTAAHKGALSAGGAPPIGVVGSGLNVVYPKSNRALWEEVAGKGLLVSETPLDIAPERWRFPARNRIIAALSDVAVIVESMTKGGAMFTVDEATHRGKPIFAVPGPIRSPSSQGTNRLLAEGCLPLCDANDVLVALGIPVSRGQPTNDAPIDNLSPEQQKLLEAFDWQPAGLEQLVERSQMPLSDIAVQLEELQSAGHIIRRGLWYERSARK